MLSSEPDINKFGFPHKRAIESKDINAPISESEAAHVEGTCITSGPLRVVAASIIFENPEPQSKIVTSTFIPEFSE